MKTSPAITNFNSGELSPLMSGRADFKNYTSGCRRMRNFVPTPQGPARRRMGTRFVAEVKNSADRVWLGKFVFNNAQSYVLEFGPAYIRFFSQHGVVGAPFEVVSPYSAADLTDSNGLFGLRMVQSGDILYIACKGHQTEKLVRTSASTFAMVPFSPSDGPFNDIDLSNTTLITASATSGFIVNLVATAPVFNPDLSNLQALTGTMIRLEEGTISNIKAWEPGKVIAIGDLRRSDGKTYRAVNAATTGGVKPIHDEGSFYDGDNGVQWAFVNPGYGWAGITNVIDATHCTVVVTHPFPDSCVSAGTLRWSLQPWNSFNGFPDDITFWRERLTLSRGREVWGSVAGDFESFADRDSGGVVTADMAYHFDVTSERADDIVWIAPDTNALMIGTGAAEYALYEMSVSDAFGPGNAALRKQSEHGSKRVRTCYVDDSVMFVQASGRKIRDIHMAESINIKWLSTDMNVLAEHISRTDSGTPGAMQINIIDMAYQQEPDSVLWAVMADGRFAGFTIQREQDIRGWHPHRIGGFVDLQATQFAMVEAVICIPAPDAGRDELWMVVRRFINGNYHRYIEYVEKAREQGDNPEEAFYVDCGLSLHNTRAGGMTPGAGAIVAGSVNVNFGTANLWTVADVGKYIVTTYLTENVQGEILWKKGVALITSFTNIGNVLATILSPFPQYQTTATPSGHLIGNNIVNPGYGYIEIPILTVAGGGGAGATAIALMTVLVAKSAGLTGAGYNPDDVYQVNGGVFTRPALLRPIDFGATSGWQVVDGGSYSVLPGAQFIPGGGLNAMTVVGLTQISGPGAGAGANANLYFGIGGSIVTNPGTTPYTSVPAVTAGGVAHAPFAVGLLTAILDSSSLTPGTFAPLSIPQGQWRVSVTSIAGLNHLEGQVVDVCADGAAQGQKVVVGGAIALDSPASIVHVGLPCPAVLQPMPIEPMATALQSTQGKNKRAAWASILFHESLGVKYGRDELSTMDTLDLREPVDPMDQALPLFTGVKRVNWPDGYNEQMLLTIKADQPLPCTIAALIPRVEVQEDS